MNDDTDAKTFEAQPVAIAILILRKLIDSYMAYQCNDIYELAMFMQIFLFKTLYYIYAYIYVTVSHVKTLQV